MTAFIYMGNRIEFAATVTCGKRKVAYKSFVTLNGRKKDVRFIKKIFNRAAK